MVMKDVRTIKHIFISFRVKPFGKKTKTTCDQQRCRWGIEPASSGKRHRKVGFFYFICILNVTLSSLYRQYLQENCLGFLFYTCSQKKKKNVSDFSDYLVTLSLTGPTALSCLNSTAHVREHGRVFVLLLSFYFV